MYNELMKKKDITFPKHSALVEISNSRITAIQRKAFDGMIYLAREQLKTNPIKYKYSISAKILMNMISIGEDNYTYLNKFLSELKNINIKYNILGKDKKSEWGEFSMLAGYSYKNGEITYSFPHQIQDAIIDPDIYAWIDMVVIKGLKSKYAVALYEYIQDYVNVGHPITLALDRFKELMGVPEGKYKSFFNFKQRVIDQAMNEINASPGIKFIISITPKKTGRRYTHVFFTIKPKQQKQQIKQQLDGQQLSLLLSMLPERYRSKTAERLLNKHKDKGAGYIKAQIEYTNNAEPNQYIAYLRKALENDYAGFEKGDLTKELERQEKEKQRKRKEAELKKKLKEEEERKQLKLAWESLDEEKKNEYIAKAAVHNTWLRQVLIKGEKNKHEELVEGIAMEELKKYMQHKQ